MRSYKLGWDMWEDPKEAKGIEALNSDKSSVPLEEVSLLLVEGYPGKKIYSKSLALPDRAKREKREGGEGRGRRKGRERVNE